MNRSLIITINERFIRDFFLFFFSVNDKIIIVTFLFKKRRVDGED